MISKITDAITTYAVKYFPCATYSIDPDNDREMIANYYFTGRIKISKVENDIYTTYYNKLIDLFFKYGDKEKFN